MSTFEERFRLERYGQVMVVSPAGDIESLEWDLSGRTTEGVLKPLREQTPRVVFDLSNLGYFGSVFLSLLLRCHTIVKGRGGEMVLCGVSKTAAELLRITALDTLWRIYDTRDDALEALS